MKITPTGPAAASSRRGRVEGPGKGGGAAFARLLEADTPAPAELSGPASLSALGGLLAMQEVPASSAERRQAIDQGRSLLDELDQLRLAMIDGSVEAGSLQRLSNMLRRRRPALADPMLNGVLDEIELRAAVELAKLEQQAAAQAPNPPPAGPLPAEP